MDEISKTTETKASFACWKLLEQMTAARVIKHLKIRETAIATDGTVCKVEVDLETTW